MTKIPRRIDYSKKFVGMGGVFPTYKPANDHAFNRISEWKCSICNNTVYHLSDYQGITRHSRGITHDCKHVELHSQTSINK
jgi:hypothetical protein